MRITILLLLFSYGALKSQNSFSPNEVSSSLQIVDTGVPNKTVKSSEMSVDLTLPGRDWVLEYACTDGERLNILCRANNKYFTNTLISDC